MPVTVGYFDDGANRAGTGRYLTELISAMDRQRFTPVFFAPSARPWHDDLSRLDVELVYGETRSAVGPALLSQSGPSGLSLPASPRRRILPPGLAWFAGLSRDILRLRQLFRRRRVDILHSNNTGAEPAPLAARLAGIPRIAGTLHTLPAGDVSGAFSTGKHRLLERRSMRSLHHAIACCQAARQEWAVRCGLPANFASVIYNGVEVQRVARKHSRREARQRLGLPEEGVLVAAVGNLYRVKGYETLLQALAEVHSQPGSFSAGAEPTVRVTTAIAGTGPMEMELRERAAALNLGKNVRMLGYCADIGTLLDAADLFVLPSWMEACPMAVLEASAAGLPVIASSVGGVPELVETGNGGRQTGVLVPPRDPGALSEALRLLIGCPEAREEFGAAGRQRVSERFTRDQMAAKTFEIYERMLEANCRIRR